MEIVEGLIQNKNWIALKKQIPMKIEQFVICMALRRMMDNFRLHEFNFLLVYTLVAGGKKSVISKPLDKDTSNI